MAAAEKVSALGVVRIVVGELFPAEFALEIHHGIEAADGEVEYTRLDEHRLSWEEARALVTPGDWMALVRIIQACESEALGKHPVAKVRGKKLFNEIAARSRVANKPFSPL